jgi:hypothetical protein
MAKDNRIFSVGDRVVVMAIIGSTIRVKFDKRFSKRLHSDDDKCWNVHFSLIELINDDKFNIGL